VIRPFHESDRAAVLELNAQNVPEVGELDETKLDILLDESISTLVIEVDHAVVGFMILLGPGGAYGSPNYAWFSERYDDFLYVDRIAIAVGARGQGWGPSLYGRFESLAIERASGVMLAEVNTVPPNPRSLRFHDVFGFVELARVQPYDGEEEVAMLAKTLPT